MGLDNVLVMSGAAGVIIGWLLGTAAAASPALLRSAAIVGGGLVAAALLTEGAAALELWTLGHLARALEATRPFLIGAVLGAVIGFENGPHSRARENNQS